MSTHAASQPIWESGALFERTCLARRLAGTGAECGFPAAELLSVVALVLAGRDQGGVPRPRQHRRVLRPCGSKSELRNPAAQRRFAKILRQPDPPPRLPPLQRLPPRSLRLPILLGGRRPHLRSHHPALERWPDHLGKRGRGLLAL